MNTNNTIGRRTVLAGAGAAAALSVAPRGLRAAGKNKVLVIGAGLSGLNAALILQEAGMDVRVIEGRDRVGGRLLSHRNVPGNPESGGTGFAPGYARIVSACNKYGVGMIDTSPIIPFFFQRELFLGGERIPAAAWPAHPRNPFPEPVKKLMPWAFLGATVGPKNPLTSNEAWLDPANSKLDVPLHDWLAGLGWSDDMIRMAYDMNPGWGNSAREVSTLMVLGALKFAQIQQELAKGKAMGLIAKGGNQAITEAMAAALKNPVEFNCKVAGIRAEKSGVEVHTDDHRHYNADHVICSIPTTVLRQVKIEPALVGAQALGVQKLGAQVISLMHLVPKDRFWEKDGMAPGFVSDGLVNMVLAEHKGADPKEVTSLTVWLRAKSALKFDELGEKEAKATVVREIEKLRPAAKGKLEVLAYHSWTTDPFSLGDWAVWAPGQISAFAHDIGKPAGRLHFCGEHTAVSNRGMEGAMESGERAALEVLQSA